MLVNCLDTIVFNVAVLLRITSEVAPKNFEVDSTGPRLSTKNWINWIEVDVHHICLVSNTAYRLSLITKHWTIFGQLWMFNWVCDRCWRPNIKRWIKYTSTCWTTMAWKIFTLLTQYARLVVSCIGHKFLLCKNLWQAQEWNKSELQSEPITLIVESRFSACIIRITRCH